MLICRWRHEDSCFIRFAQLEICDGPGSLEIGTGGVDFSTAGGRKNVYVRSPDRKCSSRRGEGCSPRRPGQDAGLGFGLR